MIDEFYKFDGTHIPNIVDYLKDYIRADQEAEFIVMIGVDSLPHGLLRKRATFTEVIALHKLVDGIGHGAHCLRRRSSRVKVSGTHERLLEEAYRLVSVAQLLRDGGIEKLKNVRHMDPQLDFNKKDGWESKKYLAEAVGYVNGMGFTCNVKPDAPAASYAADHICRYKEQGTVKMKQARKEK